MMGGSVHTNTQHLHGGATAKTISEILVRAPVIFSPHTLIAESIKKSLVISLAPATSTSDR